MSELKKYSDKTELCYLSAIEIMDGYRKKHLKPSVLTEALIQRIEKINPTVNALADTYFDDARRQSIEADQAYLLGENLLPLLGLPVLVKDAQRVKGRRTTHGSLLHMDDPVETISDPMIERLEAAGAIILGRTTTPEFCISGVCRSRAWGNTVNPYNLSFGTGGSSGGSGAALAAGFAPIATGTDIGGSIRIPASCCGVVGFKPPHGRNPDGPPANFDRYNHCGPLARDIGDLALIQNIISGAHLCDHDSLREKVTLPLESHTSLEGKRIAYSMDFGYRKIDATVQENTLKALEVFKSLGATVEEVQIDWNGKCDEAASHWYNSMHYLRQAYWAAQKTPEQLNDYTLAAATQVPNTQHDDVSWSWEIQHEMYQKIGEIFEEYDWLICPTTAVPAVSANHDPCATDYKINGEVVDPEYGWVLTHHFNMLHNCPVMAVPSGFSKESVPTGIQIVGKSFDDASVFEAAFAYEKHMGGFLKTEKTRPSFINSTK